MTKVYMADLAKSESLIPLLQLRKLRLGFFKDGNVGIGVLPEGKEILVGGFGFGSVARHRVGAAEAKMRQSSERKVDHNAAMVQKLLELGGCRGSIMFQKVSFAAHVRGIHSPQLKLWRPA